jgi:hypothetical protein
MVLGPPRPGRLRPKLEEDIAFHVLTANNMPDFLTRAEFWTRHLVVLTGVFVQVLRLCRQAKLVKLGHVALAQQG